MAYRTEPIPYENANRDMAPSALKMAFASTMASLPQRVDRISHYLHESAGAMITAQSSDDEIDQLPKFIAQLGGLWNPRKLLIGNGESGASEKLAREILGHEPGLTLNPETVEMVFDASLLWGEAFRHRSPEARWAVGSPPKSSVDYGDPVLIGPYKYLSEFGVRRELFGFVEGPLNGEPSQWTLTEIMKLRAFSLGLAPDPRRRVMP